MQNRGRLTKSQQGLSKFLKVLHLGFLYSSCFCLCTYQIIQGRTCINWLFIHVLIAISMLRHSRYMYYTILLLFFPHLSHQTCHVHLDTVLQAEAWTNSELFVTICNTCSFELDIFFHILYLLHQFCYTLPNGSVRGLHVCATENFRYWNQH